MLEPARRLEFSEPGSRRIVRTMLFTVVLFLVLAVSAGAESPAIESSAAAAESATPSAYWSGLWIYLDPLTGELRARPTAEQAAWRRSQPMPNALFNKSSDGLVPFELEDGGRGVHLADRFRHALVVTVAEDGSLETRCSDHDHAALDPAGDPVHAASDEAPVR